MVDWLALSGSKQDVVERQTTDLWIENIDEKNLPTMSQVLLSYVVYRKRNLTASEHLQDCVGKLSPLRAYPRQSCRKTVVESLACSHLQYY